MSSIEKVFRKFLENSRGKQLGGGETYFSKVATCNFIIWVSTTGIFLQLFPNIFGAVFSGTPLDGRFWNKVYCYYPACYPEIKPMEYIGALHHCDQILLVRFLHLPKGVKIEIHSIIFISYFPVFCFPYQKPTKVVYSGTNTVRFSQT